MYGGGCTRVLPCAWGCHGHSPIAGSAWALYVHQQVQGEEHSVHGKHFLCISHNRRHPRRFSGLSLKAAQSSVFFTQPWVGWEITSICCWRCRSTNPRHRGVKQIQVIKRSSSDQVSLLERSVRDGMGVLQEGAAAAVMWDERRRQGLSAAPTLSRQRLETRGSAR